MQTKPQRFSFYVQAIFWVSLCLRVFFIFNHDLQAEEAYYWNYSVHLDFGYIDHPPLVAVLIKLSTTVFGLNEFAVRFPALLCWGIAAFFQYRWCEIIQKDSGQFSILLLSILPFFFVDSCIITPDMPMFAAWSAGLYFLYRALCLREARAWYAVGISLGLGLLAKYSIGLIIIATGIFVLTNEGRRRWLRRKEPYYAALITLTLFSPVLYWNSLHNWASFAFQSTRRLQTHFSFSLQELIGWLILFLTPMGLIGLRKLFKHADNKTLPTQTITFLQTYTLVPLLVYTIYSCFYGTKFNWIGPGLLAILPWLSYLMYQKLDVLRQWLNMSPLLIGTYTLIMFCISYGQPEFLNKMLFTKMVSWERLTEDLYQVAASHSTQKSKPVFMPLDLYGIASELNFYQTKQRKTQPNLEPYSVVQSGLMFGLWTSPADLHGKTVVLISPVKNRLENDTLKSTTQPLSSIQSIWGVSQGQESHTVRYYYQIVRML